MELLEIGKSIEEQIPLLICGCLTLSGYAVYPYEVDSLMREDNFDGFTFPMVEMISRYKSAVEFIGQCKIEKFRELNGNLVIALSNFLLMDISPCEGFISPNLNPMELCRKLDLIFAKQHVLKFPEFIQTMFSDIFDLSMLVKRNEVMLYLLINFYLSVYESKVVVFDSMIDNIETGFLELSEFVENWDV